jgi:hypothetical protein
VATVTFIVQSNGSQRLVESQNAAGRDHSRHRVARADGPHHIVAAARADQHLLTQPQFARRRFLQKAGRFVAGNKRRQRALQLRANGLDDRARPLVLLDIEQGRAAGVAEFHDFVSCQPKIQIIVRQQHRRQSRVMLRLLAFEPQDFGGSESGQDGVANFFDDGRRTAQLVRDLIAFGGSRSIAPKLGRANDLALLIQRHEAVLLSAHPDRSDFAGGSFGLFQRVLDGVAGGVNPSAGMLFFGAGRQARNQTVSPQALSDDRAIARINNEDFGGLSAAIDA